MKEIKPIEVYVHSTKETSVTIQERTYLKNRFIVNRFFVEPKTGIFLQQEELEDILVSFLRWRDKTQLGIRGRSQTAKDFLKQLEDKKP